MAEEFFLSGRERSSARCCCAADCHNFLSEHDLMFSFERALTHGGSGAHSDRGGVGPPEDFTLFQPVTRWVGKKFFQCDALSTNQQLAFRLEAASENLHTR